MSKDASFETITNMMAITITMIWQLTELLERFGNHSNHKLKFRERQKCNSITSRRTQFVSIILTLKINGSRVIAIEHDDHLPDGFGIERRPCSIGERLAEFSRADLTRTIFVHLGKDVPQELGIGWSRHRDRGCRFEMRRKDCANDTLFLFVCLFVCLFIPCDREQNNHAWSPMRVESTKTNTRVAEAV